MFCTRSIPNKLKFIQRSVRNHHHISGIVGGITNSENAKILSPALSYLDQVHLRSFLKNTLTDYNLPKSRTGTELLPAGFDENKYLISIGLLNSENSNDIYSCRNALRRCVGTGVRALQNRDIREILIDPCGDPEAAAEGAHLASFVFDQYKSIENQLVKPNISCFTKHLNVDNEEMTRLMNSWNRGTLMAMSQNVARKWMEMPANILTPSEFARQIEFLMSSISGADNPSISTTIHGVDWCRTHKLNGLLSVASGSHQDPVFLEIVYTGNPDVSDHVALVGKGVLFDSGGISIKPSSGMKDMRGDMGGAAVCVATVYGLAKLKANLNVRLYIPLCENMPGGGAMRPGDIIHMANGKTVEVDNTDAEGRLILADALHMAQSSPNLPKPPSLILDVATLTGAICVALGNQYSGMFYNSAFSCATISNVSGGKTNDPKNFDHQMISWPAKLSSNSHQHQNTSLIDLLLNTGQSTGDMCWPMPLLYKDKVSKMAENADLTNSLSGSSRSYGGSGSAASFLNYFVQPTIPWVHLDIASVMKSNTYNADSSTSMSGRPVRTMIEFLSRLV